MVGAEERERGGRGGEERGVRRRESAGTIEEKGSAEDTRALGIVTVEMAPVWRRGRV